MKKIFKNILPILALSFLTIASLSNSSIAAITNPYPEPFEEVMEKYNIDRTNIRSQKTLVKRTTNNKRIFGYETFIRFNDCKGYLKVFQHRFGRVDQVYTKGECKVPGIKSF